MPQLQGIDFSKHIKSQELQSVYMLYGEEKYFLKNSQAKLEKSVPITANMSFNYNEFSDSSSVDDIADAAFAMPFMAEMKIVIVKDFNIEAKNATEINKLNELLDDLNPSTVLIFTYPTLVFKQTSKWKNFIKTVATNGDVVKFEALSSQQLSKFIQRIASGNNCNISKYNCDKIIQYVGSDMNSINNEVNKIASYAENGEITTEIIEKMVVKNLETTVFILIKSILSSNYSRAYSQLDLLFTNGEEPIAILARISDNFVDLYRVRAALESGKNALSPAKYGEYKGREFRLTNSERDVRNFSNQKLIKCLELLVQSDLLLKSSKISGKIVLEELIAKLLIISKGEQ